MRQEVQARLPVGVVAVLAAEADGVLLGGGVGVKVWLPPEPSLADEKYPGERGLTESAERNWLDEADLWVEREAMPGLSNRMLS